MLIRAGPGVAVFLVEGRQGGRIDQRRSRCQIDGRIGDAQTSDLRECEHSLLIGIDARLIERAVDGCGEEVPERDLLEFLFPVLQQR